MVTCLPEDEEEEVAAIVEARPWSASDSPPVGVGGGW